MSDTIHLPLAVATRLCAELDAGENADTPESNAAERMAYSGEYMVPTKVARRLERERDEARADVARLRSMSHVEMMSENLNVYDHTVEWENRCLKAERERDEAQAWIGQIFRLLGLPDGDMGALENFRRERDETREALENQTASTIHTCHDKCKRPMCVLRRELVEARAELQRARVENNHNWQAMEMAEQAFRERNAWRAMATELADAAAYGLAQWNDGYSPEVCRKIGETIMRFQKMQKEAEE